jgi:protein SFI1
VRGRLRLSEFASNLQHYQRRHASASTQNDRQEYHPISNRARNGGDPDGHVRGSQPHDARDFEGRGGLDETASSLRSQESRDLGFDVPQEVLYRPSDTQLIRDADTFEHFRTRAVAKNAIRQWRGLAVNAYHDHHDMEERAIAHDAGILKRQAFDQWRNLSLAKKQIAETERFFSHLERRAGRARDLYLLTKAFTHWAECASEEVERTSVARRHILRTRYFNAWLEVTAVNNLKVRRQRLGKFFSLWKQGFDFQKADNTRAVTFYCNNLVETIYWRWFWKFCERRAPEWRNARLKRQYFAQWIVTHRVDAERTVWATVSHEDKLKKRYFGRWVAKTRIVQLNQQRAEQHFQSKLASRSVSRWRQQLQFLPKTRRVEGMVNWRIVSTAFSTLVVRFRLEKQAEQVNKERILRRAWTEWNDRLRLQTLAHQINDRLMVQALYKWVLAERFVLLRRLHEERLKRRALIKLTDHWKTLASSHTSICQTITDTRNQKLLQAVFTRFQTKLHMHRQNARLAHEFHAPKATSESLHLWTTRLAHTRQLHTWARDASFYFRCTRTLQRWRTAVTASQAQKRRTAYATIRRMTKMNLARRLLQNWHAQSVHIVTLHQSAEEIAQQRDMQFATSLFDRWRDRLDFVLAAQESASQNYSGELAHQHLQLWHARFSAQREADTKAVDFATSHVQKIAYEALRSLQLKVFEYRSHAQTAAELRAWNQRRHFRALLRVWVEKTLLRRGGDAMPATDFARSYLGRRAGRGQQTPATVRADAGVFWLGGGESDGRDGEGRETGSGRAVGQGDDPTSEDDNFELGDWIPALEAQSNMTPLPGYLSTPSKRAARARAMVRGGLGGLGGLGAAGGGDVAAIAGTGGGSGIGVMDGLAIGSTTPATPRTARNILPTRTPLTRKVPATERRAPAPEGRIGRTPLSQGARPPAWGAARRNELGRSVFGRSTRGSLAVGFADIPEDAGRDRSRILG